MGSQRPLVTAEWYCEKKVLNSDGQEFHQYKKNQQPHLSSI